MSGQPSRNGATVSGLIAGHFPHGFLGAPGVFDFAMLPNLSSSATFWPTLRATPIFGPGHIVPVPVISRALLPHQAFVQRFVRIDGVDRLLPDERKVADTGKSDPVEVNERDIAETEFHDIARLHLH